MSNTIIYDPLLADYLASELNVRLRERRLGTFALFAPDRSVSLAIAGGEELRADLHPTRGWIRILADLEAQDEGLDALCLGVSAIADERIIRLDLEEVGRFQSATRSLYFELHGNQWNAVLVGGDGRIISVLLARRAGSRSLFPGELYQAPAGLQRFGIGELTRSEGRARWGEVLDRAVPAERMRLLVRHFAWTGTLNASWIVGNDAEPWCADEAFERWWWLRSRPPARPHLLQMGGSSQPYPLLLSGYDAQPMPSLLEAMALAADTLPPATADPEVERAERLGHEQLAAAQRRLIRLQEQFTDASGVEELSALGDLLLARIRDIPPRAARVELEGWSGERHVVELDPALSPAENAARYYQEAGRKRRATERLPALVASAEAEIDRWREALAAIAAGQIPQWVQLWIQRRSGQKPAAAVGDISAALPYRLFRTSGGLEVRVGRNARDNDRLTFHTSASNDVWLHARSVPGSHVILRWPDPSGSPPIRDLTEAAQLAALFSRARTSGTVAVDWTRRKYVRKPRGAAPGAVVPQRVRTLFVEPDPEVLERLALRE